MPYYIVSKTGEALNSYRKPLKDSRILILGIAYKKDIDDASESPAIKIIELLAARGALVEYHDPFIPTTSPKRYPEMRRSSVPLDLDHLSDYDLVILATDHSSFPYEQIHEHSRLILDTQNAFKTRSDKIIKAYALNDDITHIYYVRPRGFTTEYTIHTKRKRFYIVNLLN